MKALFIVGISIDILTLLNAIYHQVSDMWRGYSSGHNGPYLFLAFLFFIWIVLCFHVRSTGKSALAAGLAWIPATFILLLAFLFTIVFSSFKADFQ